MYSENGVLVDFDEIAKLVADADVFTVGFANIPERLIVDARSDGREAPLVQIVEPIGSAQKRLAWLLRRRPTLGSPQAFTFFAWPHSPGFLIETGIWERIRRRVGADSDPEVKMQCDLAIKQLQNLDAEASLAILRGERCLTLWPPQPDEPDD